MLILCLLATWPTSAVAAESCLTDISICGLRLGMTEAECIGAMGQPDKIEDDTQRPPVRMLKWKRVVAFLYGGRVASIEGASLEHKGTILLTVDDPLHLAIEVLGEPASRDTLGAERVFLSYSVGSGGTLSIETLFGKIVSIRTFRY